MSILVNHLPKIKVVKSNLFSQAAIFPFLIPALILLTGCVPQAPDPHSTVIGITQAATGTAVAVPAASSLPVSDPIGTDTATPTSSPTMLPTSTQTESVSRTFISEEDAYVKQSDPAVNFGDDTTLKVDSGSSADESFVRFTVTEVSGAVQNATLRLYAGKNGSRNGPIAYTTSESWSEKEITWKNRPAHDNQVLDNKDLVEAESWVEYDVTPAVTGEGTFTFVLAADSGDAVAFSSREGGQAPELVVTFIPGGLSSPTATPLSGDAVVVAAGDISMCSNDNDALTAQLLADIPGTVLALGDNAYPNGDLSDYMDCYNPTWGQFKDRTYPIPGNHDYRKGNSSGYFQYFKGISPYYAYDLGDWRIYALNSNIDVTEGSEQIKWLQQDLAEHPRQCVLAYWHHPRWSSGSKHGSDADMQVLWETFYNAGAELVLNGHEHSYERFMPMDAKGLSDPQGMRAFVVGTGGSEFYPFGPALGTSEVRDNTTYGVLKLTLHEDSYDWAFVPAAGYTFTDSGSARCH